MPSSTYLQTVWNRFFNIKPSQKSKDAVGALADCVHRPSAKPSLNLVVLVIGHLIRLRIPGANYGPFRDASLQGSALLLGQRVIPEALNQLLTDACPHRYDLFLTHGCMPLDGRCKRGRVFGLHPDQTLLASRLFPRAYGTQSLDP